MGRRAVALVLLALPATARADGTAAAVGWSAVGVLDLSFLVFDAVTVARKKPPGLAYAIVETVLSAPQVVIGPLAIAAGAVALQPGCTGFFCDRDVGVVFIAAGAALTLLAALALAHGIWAAATRGWANAPRVH